MNISYEKIKSLVSEVTPRIIDIRHDIHSHPELSEQEVRTAGLIQAELDRLGIPYISEVAGHGVKAVIAGEAGGNASEADEAGVNAVAIRADMDALPINEKTNFDFKSQTDGVMHACGHDIHTSILLGTANVLTALAADGYKLPQPVVLLFEPAEETRGGAMYMIDEGCLENPHVGSVLGLHIEPSVDVGKLEFIPGTMNAASTEFTVTVKGKSCHGASPFKGIDPLLPACNMVSSLQSIITRHIHPVDAALITVGKFNSGTAGNIIPDESTFKGIIRVLDMKNRTLIKDELTKLCNGIAEAYGATCSVEYKDSYPTLVNDDELLEKISADMQEKLGEENILINPKSSLGADDFAYFCHASKGLYFNLGSHTPGTPYQALHSAELRADEGCISLGILSEVLAILKIMEVDVE